MLMHVIQHTVHHASDGAGVLTYLFQRLHVLFIFWWLFFWCHFMMTTQVEYIKIVVQADSCHCVCGAETPVVNSPWRSGQGRLEEIWDQIVKSESQLPQQGEESESQHDLKP